MKIQYTCEVCGKVFETEKEAKQCEAEHKLADKQEELKNKSSATITELMNKHIQTFHEFPDITLSGEAHQFIVDDINNTMKTSIEEIVSLFLGE